MALKRLTALSCFATCIACGSVEPDPPQAVPVNGALFNSASAERQSPHPGANTAKCTYNLREKLSLNEATFDQDWAKGWREVAARRGCEHAAAELIETFREENGSESHILLWHEGQMRAMSGEVDLAIELFRATKKKGADPLGLNIYTDATIAFLLNDYKALLDSRRALSAVEWPTGKNLNLMVVDGFIRCFGRSYREAYLGCKR